MAQHGMIQGFCQGFRSEVLSPPVFGVWAFYSILMALSGPFGSYGYAGPVTRLLFWATVVLLALVAGAVVRLLLRRLAGGNNFWRHGPISSFTVAALLVLPCHAAAQTLMAPPGQVVPGRLEFAAFLFFLVLSGCAFRQAFRQEAERVGAEPVVAEPVPGPVADVPPPESEAPALPRLMQRIDPELRAPPLRMSVRDHYVDLVTEAGTASILMRFSDAIAEMEEADGLRVHRSHWVAAPAVVATGREGGRPFLELADGSRVPVSRPYVAELEARGLM